MIFLVILAITCIKFLLIYSYYSTDFFVHKNWLAITYQLSLNDWYKANHSIWTLDYPPFFAYFEYIISHISSNILNSNQTNELLQIRSEPSYNVSSDIVIYQRLTVIISDLIFGYFTCKFLNNIKIDSQQKVIFALLLFGNISLLVIDHIHFQYNGLLFGILIWSIFEILHYRLFKGAILYAILLNFKHLFLCMAPVYGLYLLKNYCTTIEKFFKLAISTCIVFGLSFGPFWNQLSIIFHQLFPFGRGLCHAYWAPNFWPLYIMMDKMLKIIAGTFQFQVNTETGSMTGGLVKVYKFVILPDITPIHCAILTIISQLPLLYKIWKVNESKKVNNFFLKCLILGSMCSFYFGWHIHEKSILTFCIPLTILLMKNYQLLKIYQIITISSTYSILPLLHTNELILLKLTLFLIYFLFIIFIVPLYLNINFKKILKFGFERYYYFGLLLLFLYENLQNLFFKTYLQFLPLMLTSCYCSIGILYGFIELYLNLNNI